MLAVIFIVLLASHGYVILQTVIQHILERALWRGSVEEKMMESQELEVRQARVQASSDRGDLCGQELVAGRKVIFETSGLKGSSALFQDRGLREIENSVKIE